MSPFLIERTPQEAVDAVVRGAHAQGWAKSSDNCGVCYYRSPEGFKCHAGHLLPDDIARAHNSASAEELLASGVLAVAHPDTTRVIRRLQAAHDGNAQPEIRAGTWFAVRDLGLRWPENVPVPPGFPK
jgi:hypothetical protein